MSRVFNRLPTVREVMEFLATQDPNAVVVVPYFTRDEYTPTVEMRTGFVWEKEGRVWEHFGALAPAAEFGNPTHLSKPAVILEDNVSEEE